MSCTLPLAFLVILGFISLPAAASCEYYIQRGTPFSIPLNYKELSLKELTWKHNGNVIFKRKNGKFKPGKAEDISNEGSLKLKELTLADNGTYTAEVFNSDGTISCEKSFILCVMEKVSKPSVKFTCSDKDIIFTCTLTNSEGVTFQWNQNRKLLVGKTETTLTIPLKPQKPDTFTCSAVNNVSRETSDPIKPTCNASCEYYIQRGTHFSIPLNYTELSLKELTWKHNGNVIFKRKNEKFKPGKAEDISNEGSLKLKELTLADNGIYTAEVFNSDGTISYEKSFILCVMEKLSKPSVKFTCSDKDVIFTCTLTNTEGVTFKWSQNRKLLVGKTETTLTIGLKQLKEPDTFTCSAVNKVSRETSDPIKPTCNAVSDSGVPGLLFGFDFLTMVCILAGGGGLVLLLLIISLVCCCRSRRKSQMHSEDEKEMRLAPLTKPQHPSHPEGQKQRQRPPGGAPPGSTGPRPNARASSQDAPQPRAQARGRPPQTPMDDDEEQPPPLPQPRKKGPHPPRQ